jgi:hypothetical protein
MPQRVLHGGQADQRVTDAADVVGELSTVEGVEGGHGR